MYRGHWRVVFLVALFLSCLVSASAQASRPAGVWGLGAFDGLMPSLRGRLEQQFGSVLDSSRRYAGNSTLPGPSGERNELRVIVISDLNGRYGSTDYGEAVHRAVDEIIARRPDVVISTGDMVAGQREGLDYRAMWQSFHSAVTWRLRDAGIPFLITPGNHDGAGTRRFVHERSIFIDEWTQNRPKVQFVDDRFYPARYSAVVGPVFFVSLDATTVGALSAEQMAWLDEQLAIAEHYPVKIVYGHIPLYAVASNKRREIIGDPAFEDLLNRHQVQAYISGHHHTYYPGARGRLRLVSMPCLGSGLRRLIAVDQGYGSRGFVEFVATPDGLYDLDAWKAPEFREVIERESLPAKVGLAAGPLVRDDLLGLDLRSRSLLISKTGGEGLVMETGEGAPARHAPIFLPTDLFD